MLQVLFVGATAISLLGSLTLLAFTYVVSSMWFFPRTLIWASIALVAMALAVYFAVGHSVIRRYRLARQFAYVLIACGMMSSFLPVGLLTGVAIAMTGVWHDPPGSHSDNDVNGPIGLALLGLLCGPVVSCLGACAAWRRFNRTHPRPAHRP